jgi:hypothetical protein
MLTQTLTTVANMFTAVKYSRKKQQQNTIWTPKVGKFWVRDFLRFFVRFFTIFCVFKSLRIRVQVLAIDLLVG